MKKIMLSVGITAIAIIGIAATDVKNTADESFTIGGLKPDSGVADTKVEKSKGRFDLLDKIAGLDIPNPFSSVSVPDSISKLRIGNPIDPSTWWDGDQGVIKPVIFNFADPEFYMDLINPDTHSNFHKGITNPETWAQFAKLETYTNMVDAKVWVKWFDLKTYDPMLDLQTYAYWMQPGAFGHHLELDRFENLANPDAYGTIVNAALSNVGYSFKLPEDGLSLDGWLGSVSKIQAVSASN